MISTYTGRIIECGIFFYFTSLVLYGKELLINSEFICDQKRSATKDRISKMVLTTEILQSQGEEKIK